MSVCDQVCWVLGSKKQILKDTCVKLHPADGVWQSVMGSMFIFIHGYTLMTEPMPRDTLQNDNAQGKRTCMDPLYDHIVDAKTFVNSIPIEICPYAHRQWPIA